MEEHDQDALRAQRHEVERLLGLNLLRLQAYERLVKAIVASHKGTASLDPSGKMRVSPAINPDGQTLGMLVNQMLGSVVVPDGPSGSPVDDLLPSGDSPAFGFAFQVSFPTDSHTAIENGLRALVSLRNDLVDDFLDRHDLGHAEGCRLAQTALTEATETIDRHLGDLKQWARDSVETKRTLSAIIGSAAFRDRVVRGAVDWPDRLIVAELRRAAAELSFNGWTRVSEAADWIAARHPAETPAAYGCKSWRQLLHDSGLFDLHYFPVAGRREAW